MHVPFNRAFIKSYIIYKTRTFSITGGILVIAVPNENDWLKNISEAYSAFSYFRAHLSYFTPETLQYVLEMAGFERHSISIMGDQMYSLESAINWLRNQKPVLTYLQTNIPSGLEWIEEYYETVLFKNVTSDSMISHAKY